jgi:hypothetical protein
MHALSARAEYPCWVRPFPVVEGGGFEFLDQSKSSNLVVIL